MPHTLIKPAENQAVAGGATEPTSNPVALFPLECEITNLREAHDSLAHIGWRFWISGALKNIEQLLTIMRG